ncbi:hypothetical protein BSKO_05712 [Bryopsis sp. KO-2023]|nr:hypothetical protein BSKO_05712 [Bryopsis sp. KO-2023]
MYLEGFAHGSGHIRAFPPSNKEGNFFDTDVEPSVWSTRWKAIGEERVPFLDMHCLTDFGFKEKVPPSGPGIHKLTSGNVLALVRKWPTGKRRSDKNARSNCKVRFLKNNMIR